MKNLMQKNNNTEKNLQELRAKAADYLANRGYPTSGVVVFYNGEIQGWVNKLRDPQHWMPGCIAVTHGDSFYITTGGDDYNGAAQWEPISIASKEPIATPKIGQYWEGQGGIYVGPMLDGETHIHLIMATQAFKGAWGEFGKNIPGEFIRSNGSQNTKLILDAEPNNILLNEIITYTADSHQDFYLPALSELNLIFICASKHCEKTWHWSSTQYSAHDAWRQYFGVGDQGINGKSYSLAARAVRRLPI